jgi:hypothetical protein
MVSSTLLFLTTINDHYANLIWIAIASITAFIAFREYLLRRRPYVMSEILFEKKDDKWFFNLGLINRGEYPAITKITKAVLKIGDEEYPTTYTSEILLPSNVKEKLAPVGHINQVGRRKIVGHEYRSNRVEIIFCINSKSLGQRRFRYQTRIEYEVDVNGDEPVFRLIKEEML